MSAPVTADAFRHLNGRQLRRRLAEQSATLARRLSGDCERLRPDVSREELLDLLAKLVTTDIEARHCAGELEREPT